MTFYKSTDHTIPAQSQAHLHSDRYIHTGLLNFYLILSYHNTFIESLFSLTLSHRPFLGFQHNIQSVSSHLSSLSALHLRIDLMGPCIDLLYVQLYIDLLYVQLYKVRMHVWEVFWCPNLLSMGVLLLVLLLLVPRQCSAQNYSGFHFEDNRVEARFGPENGYLVYETNIPIPNMVTRSIQCILFGTSVLQLSVCYKIFIDFDRYGGQVGAWELFRLNETLPSLSFLRKSGTCLQLNFNEQKWLQIEKTK